MTFLEAMVVLAILALIVSIVSVSVFGRLHRVRLNRDVVRFARTLRLAAEEAILRKQTLAVVIEVYDGYYSIYEDNGTTQFGDEDQPLIARQSLDYCWIDEMEFEDSSRQFSGTVIIRATPQGWSGSLLFNLIDKDNRKRYVRCDRFTTKVTVDDQPLFLLEPHTQLSI